MKFCSQYIINIYIYISDIDRHVIINMYTLADMHVFIAYLTTQYSYHITSYTAT